MKLLLRSLGVCAAGLALTGCAIFEPDNRRTLNALDRHLTPSATLGRVALVPIGLPVGLVAGVADLCIVHPATVLDDAWGDTAELLWTPRTESRFRRALLMPLAALATPPVFLGDWLGRSIFALPPREGA